MTPDYPDSWGEDAHLSVWNCFRSRPAQAPYSGAERSQQIVLSTKVKIIGGSNYDAVVLYVGL